MREHMVRHGGDLRLEPDLTVCVRGRGENDWVVQKLRTIVEAWYQGLLRVQLNMSGLMMVGEMTHRGTAKLEAYGDLPKPSWTNAGIFADVSSEQDVSGSELRGDIHQGAMKPYEVEQAQNRAGTLRGAPARTVGGAEGAGGDAAGAGRGGGRGGRGRGRARGVASTGP